MAFVPSRAADERVLRWLRARARGLSSYAVAKAEGVNNTTVERATAAVRKDDEAMHPNQPAPMLYWSRSAR
jgi:hypothetical protein